MAEPRDYSESWKQPEYPVEILTPEAIGSLAESMQGERVAVLDIDGTVADFMTPFCKDLNERLSLDYTPRDNTSFNIIENLQKKYPYIDTKKALEAFLEIYNQPKVYDDSPPILPATIMVKTLRELGYRIVFATSRPSTTEIMKSTQDWIARYDLPVDHLFFENGRSETHKSDLVKALTPIVQPGSIFYDDKPATIQETRLAQNGTTPRNIEAFAPHTHWNTAGSTDEFSSYVINRHRTPMELILYALEYTEQSEI